MRANRRRIYRRKATARRRIERTRQAIARCASTPMTYAELQALADLAEAINLAARAIAGLPVAQPLVGLGLPMTSLSNLARTK